MGPRDTANPPAKRGRAVRVGETHLGTVNVTLTGDEARLLRSLDRVIGKERELARKAADVGSASDKASDKAKRGLKAQGDASKKVAGDLKKLALSYVGVGAAVTAVRSFVGSLTAAWKDNAAAADNARKSAARVAALGAGTPEERRRILSRAGAIGPNQAFDLAFAAKSAQLTDKATKAIFRELQFAVRLGEDPAALGGALIPLAASTGRDIRQLSTFSRTAAATSPLDQTLFAQSFAKISGAARPGARDQASAAALLSTFVTALGGEDAAKDATTALKSFLGQAKGEKAGILFKELGAADKTSVGKLEALQAGLASGQVNLSRVIEVFGLRVGPAISAVTAGVGLPEARRQEELLTGILSRPGGLPSSLQQQAQAQAGRDTQAAAIFEIEKLKQEAAAKEVLRGFEQAPDTLRLLKMEDDLKDLGEGSAARGVVRGIGFGTGGLLDRFSESVMGGLGIQAPTASGIGGGGGGLALGLGVSPAIMAAFSQGIGAPVPGSTLATGMFASSQNRQAAAERELRLQTTGSPVGAGARPKLSVEQILADAGGLVDPGPDVRDLLTAGLGGTGPAGGLSRSQPGIDVLKDIRAKISEQNSAGQGSSPDPGGVAR